VKRSRSSLPEGSTESHNTTQTTPYYFEYERRIFSRVCKIAKSDHYLRRVCQSFRPSIRQHNSAPTELICIKFYIQVFSENLLRKPQVSWKSNKN